MLAFNYLPVYTCAKGKGTVVVRHRETTVTKKCFLFFFFFFERHASLLNYLSFHPSRRLLAAVTPAVTPVVEHLPFRPSVSLSARLLAAPDPAWSLT